MLQKALTPSEEERCDLKRDWKQKMGTTYFVTATSKRRKGYKGGRLSGHETVYQFVQESQLSFVWCSDEG